MSDLLDLVRNLNRLSALARTGLLDSPPEESFDRFTRLAARWFNTPMALVSLVDRDRQFFKSAVGLAEPWRTLRETPLAYSFCKHAVAQQTPLMIADAREDPLYRDSPAVRELNIVAYAGVPLTMSGYALGALCVIDMEPREWTATEVETLADLAACVGREIELRMRVREAELGWRDAEARIRQFGGPSAT
jgi:GAF domain-containing protein